MYLSGTAVVAGAVDRDKLVPGAMVSVPPSDDSSGSTPGSISGSSGSSAGSNSGIDGAFSAGTRRRFSRIWSATNASNSLNLPSSLPVKAMAFGDP